MSRSAQDFWLSELGAADRFNRWVLSRLIPGPEGRILEVGCGTGTFTSLLARRGQTVTGIDIEPNYVSIAQDRLAPFPNAGVYCADATDAEWDGSFDSVILLDVLEHISDDLGFLRRLGAALKPGGRLYLKVPAEEWLFGPMDAAIGHHRRYTMRILSKTLSAAGFTPVTIKRFNLAGAAGWWLNGRVLKRVTPPSEQIGLFERLVPAFRLIEAALPIPVGLSLIAVASKP